MEVKLNELQIDALREANNIGAGHAAIALSQMLNKKIMIAVTRSEIIPSELFLKNMVGGNEQQTAGVYLETLGDIQGALFYMFKRQAALKLSDMVLLRKEGESKFIDEKAQAALKEICNILSGAFFSTLADMLKVSVFHKNPCFAFDKADTIMYAVCEQVFGNRHERICLATEFIESISGVSGSFAFIPKQEAMNLLLDRLMEADD